MKRKGIQRKRIGPEAGCLERSIRMRQFKGVGRALNAAERSALGDMSVSLCGTKEAKKEKNNEKEVKKENRQSFISRVAPQGLLFHVVQEVAHLRCPCNKRLTI